MKLLLLKWQVLIFCNIVNERLLRTSKVAPKNEEVATVTIQCLFRQLFRSLHHFDSFLVWVCGTSWPKVSPLSRQLKEKAPVDCVLLSKLIYCVDRHPLLTFF